jgi:acyl dehydratase
MISRESLLRWPFEEKVQSYTRRDVILYALSIGFGCDPLDRDQLRHVLEDDLRVFPTMALVLAHPGPWTADPATGVDRKRVVHGEQRLIVHRPLPPEGTVRSRNRVTAVIDKGKDKGALIQTERELHDIVTGQLFATIQGTTFCRGDGGFDETRSTQTNSRFSTLTAERAPDPTPPARAADELCELVTLPSAALLYRLNGDYNPIHSHPVAAGAAGFDRPISHGLLTFALAARLIERSGENASDLLEICARFASPMFPGETLQLELWRGEHGRRWFRGICKERGTEVLSRGYARLADNSETAS